MSILRRAFTAVFSRVDEVVANIENHDALVQATIVEQRKKVAAATVELQRVKDQAFRISQQIVELEKQQVRWSQRALKEAASDEAKALQCVQQREIATQKAAKLNATQKQYASAIEKMKSGIGRAEEELAAMRQKQQLMRARQSTTEALNTMSSITVGGNDELDTCFDRWEVKIAQEEYGVDILAQDLDEDLEELERSYLKEENCEELREQLAQLVEESKHHES